MAREREPAPAQEVIRQDGESGPNRGRAHRPVGRLIDIVGASALLMVCAVPMAVIAVAVAVSSSGPVLFVQDRAARGGGVFRMFKFRTMTEGTDGEVTGDPVQYAAFVENDFKLRPTDDRTTPVGRVLRRTSFDELPQLVNVLLGDMSLVGVRPLFADQLAARSPYDQALYRSERPGLTGLWQTVGRSTVRGVERIELDRCYLETKTFRGDIKILLDTPMVLIRNHGAH